MSEKTTPLPVEEKVTPAEKNLATEKEKEKASAVKDLLVAQQEPSAVDVKNEDKTLSFNGVTVYPGICYGAVQTLAEGELEIPHFPIEKQQVRAESLRLRGAFSAVIKELQALAGAEHDESLPEVTAFIDMHLQILNDESLITETQNIIGDRLINAEWALSIKLDAIRDVFKTIDDDYLAERITDIEQVLERVQRVLTGRRQLTEETTQSLGDEQVILVAKDLNPADVLILRNRYDENIGGLVIEEGSETSHTAILARSLEIPTLVGVLGIDEAVENDTPILLDADNHLVTLFPKEDLLPEVRERMRQNRAVRLRQKKLRSTDGVSKDGVAIHLYSNIALPDEVRDATKNGAEGVGLFRSEFLFLNRAQLPDEDEQYRAYLRVINAMKGKPVTIRTIDIGGDKMPNEEALAAVPGSENTNFSAPALGRRAIRFSRSYPSVFDTQLRAILRASVGANVRILLPMISDVSEITFARERLAVAASELATRGVKHAPTLPLGGMIEVPGAALCLDYLLPHLDFVSLGTNDLIQYTLAVDRHDASVNYLYNPWHPAVLELIYMTAKTVAAAKKELCICGEIAGDPTMTRILVAMGLRHFSMGSERILALKENLLGIDTKEATELWNKYIRAKNLERRAKILESLK